MNAIRLIWLLFPAALLSAADNPSGATRVAVFDFKTDWHTDFKLGVTDAGEPFASLLANDLSALPPLTSVERTAVEKEQALRKVSLDSPMAPREAAEIGSLLGASVLVSGRLYRSGPDLIAAAKVMSSQTGQVSGTIVQGAASQSMADLVSRLAIKIGDIILVQQGADPIHWKSASIVGTPGAASSSPPDGPTYVDSIDGSPVADGAASWNQSRPLLPGVHEIVVRHVAVPYSPGRDLFFIAKPGSAYELRCVAFPQQRFALTIREIGSDDPVTVIVRPPMPRDTWGDRFQPSWTRDFRPAEPQFQTGMPIVAPDGTRLK